LAAGAREGVVDPRVDVNLDILAAGKGLADLGDRRGRDELVLGGELQHQRAFDLGHEVELLLDGDPVIADRAIDPRLGGGEIGELASEAEAEGADLALAGGPSAQRRHGRDDILDRLGHVKFLVEREGLLEVALVELDARLEAPEKVGRQHDIAFLGVGVGNVSDVLVNSENLLEEDDPGTAALLGRCEIGLEISAVPGRDADSRACHETPLPLALSKRSNSAAGQVGSPRDRRCDPDAKRSSRIEDSL